MVPRVALGMARFSDGVALRLSASAPGTASYLIGSTSNAIGPTGRAPLQPAAAPVRKPTSPPLQLAPAR